jgi:hypothetical protein
MFNSKLPASAITGALRKLAMTRSQTGGKAFMKFTKQGEFVYGAENVEADKVSEWAVNPASFCIGVIGWRGGSVVGERMFAITSPERVDYNDLEDIPGKDRGGKDGDGWSEQYTVDLKNMKDGTEVIFKTTSKGGKNAIGDLAQVISDQVDAHPDLPVAVVTLSSDFYKHKSFGKVYTPQFVIAGWADAEGNKGGKKPAAIAKAKRELV